MTPNIMEQLFLGQRVRQYYIDMDTSLRVFKNNTGQEAGPYTKTVYGLVFPETRQVLRQIWTGPESMDLLERPYDDRQDDAHEVLLAEYGKWAGKMVLGLSGYKHGYVTAGSTEAIRESLVGLIGRRLHVFEGEYEGYEALAKGYGIEVIRHDRDNYRDTIKGAEGDVFYLSQPSAIDGNRWGGYDAFLDVAQDVNIRVRVDLCYVGAVSGRGTINVDHGAIDCIFWSLSKSFGLYYQRVGGVFSREAIANLHGQRWFKNMTSIEVGCRMLESTTPWTMPAKYADLQGAAVRELREIGIEAVASEALMLATCSPEGMGDLVRGGSAKRARLCITSTMDRILQGKSVRGDSFYGFMDEWSGILPTGQVVERSGILLGSGQEAAFAGVAL